MSLAAGSRPAAYRPASCPGSVSVQEEGRSRVEGARKGRGRGGSFLHSSMKSRLCLPVSMTTSLLQYSAVGRPLHLKAVPSGVSGPRSLLSFSCALLFSSVFFLPLLSLCVFGGSGTSSPLAAVLFNQTPFACESGPRPAFVPRLNSPRQRAGTREIFRQTVLSMCKYWPGWGPLSSFCRVIMCLSKKKHS